MKFESYIWTCTRINFIRDICPFKCSSRFSLLWHRNKCHRIINIIPFFFHLYSLILTKLFCFVSLSHVLQLSATVALQAPLSMEFSRQWYWSGLPFTSPGDLPDPGIEVDSPTLPTDSLPSEPPGKTYERISIKYWILIEHPALFFHMPLKGM